MIVGSPISSSAQKAPLSGLEHEVPLNPHRLAVVVPELDADLVGFVRDVLENCGLPGLDVASEHDPDELALDEGAAPPRHQESEGPCEHAERFTRASLFRQRQEILTPLVHPILPNIQGYLLV